MHAGPRLSPDEASGGERRPSSVVLREGRGAGDSSPFDPANQSLAEALRVMYRLLQAGMVVLFVLFLISGITSVNEGERGLRLLFGRVEESDLEPGFRWSAPYPVGQIQKVSSGVKTLSLNKEFWVLIPPGNENSGLDNLVGSDALRPGEGGTGSVITGDGNIAHTQWKVTYRIANVRDFAHNVMTDQDDDLVRAATMRGVVEACAQVSVDDLLKQTSQQGDSVTGVARRVAQATLDTMKSGIQIEQLSLVQATPPLFVRRSFAEVQAAASKAAKSLEAARAYRRTTLTNVAGEAATLLVGSPATPEHPATPGLIDQYERDIAQGGVEGGEATLAQIDRVLANEEVRIGDERRTPGTSGEVASIISSAKGYTGRIAAEYQGELSRFRAKLAAYQANPSVAIQSEWRDALTQFHKRSNLEVMLLPPGTEWLQLMMSRDPSIRKAVEMSQREAESKKAEQQRKADLDQNKYKTQTNVQETSQ